jgi:prepilin-type N-terminal cleavage/methylation domain-containing protein
MTVLRRRGFSLIELVVAILILGVITTVAAPRMFETTDNAADRSARQTLSAIRNAIQTYHSKSQAYPPIGSGTEFQDAIGDYLNEPIPAPTCLPKHTNHVIADTSSGDDAKPNDDENAGWVYKQASGSFKLNTSNTPYLTW